MSSESPTNIHCICLSECISKAVARITDALRISANTFEDLQDPPAFTNKSSICVIFLQ